MKKWNTVVLVVMFLAVLLTACGNKNMFFVVQEGYTYSVDGYECKNITSVQKTEYWQPNERSYAQTLYVLDDDTPYTIYGIHKFQPGWYIVDTVKNGPGISGPWNSEADCQKAVDESPKCQYRLGCDGYGS